MNRKSPRRSPSFEQMLVGWDEICLQNEKFKNSLYNDLMEKAKLSKKELD